MIIPSGVRPFPRCHVCDASGVIESGRFASLHRVTSDCRPWPAGGRLGACPACGTIQSAVDDGWRAETAEIYRSYAMFHQRTGADHAVYDARNAGVRSRSSSLLERFAVWAALPERGRLLDIGCGTGPLLAAAAALRPGWDLAGAEQNDRMKERILAIPGVSRFHGGDIADIVAAGDRFDVVSMIHVLEHVAGPVGFLRQAARLLTAEGRLLIQVPAMPDNPFDLVVADHCSHFSAGTAAAAVRRAGLVVEQVAGWVAKEITLVARLPPADRPAEAPSPGGAAGDGPPCGGLDPAGIDRMVSWLNSVGEQAERLAGEGELGLLGTSIAATWLAGRLDARGHGRAAFFVDEDPVMHGRFFLGRPVLPVARIPAKSTLYCPMPPVQAATIRDRLMKDHPAGFRIEIPPPL